MPKISRRFKNINGQSIDLEIIKESQNYIEILLSPTNYKGARNSNIRNFFLLFLAFFVYLFSFSERTVGSFLLFLLIFLYLVISSLSLVKLEKITLVKGFVLNISTHYWLRKDLNQIIPLNYVHDVVINEVLHFQRVIFVLQLLSNHDYYKHSPILVLFNKLHPNKECLQKIYKEMKEII